MDLKTQLSVLAGIGPAYAQRLAYLNIKTVEDLIFHFPFRYDDFSNVTSALESQIGEKVTLTGEIWSIKNIFTRNRKIITQAIFNDGTSPINLTWFNQSWLTNQIKVGDKIQISGKVSKYNNKISIVAPVWEKLGDQTLGNQTIHTGRLVPVYPETAGLTSKWIRTKIDQILPRVIDEVQDPLPKEIIGEMLGFKEAVKLIHFPENYGDVNASHERLGFDELFLIQLATLKTRLEWKEKPSIEKFQISNFKFQINQFIDSLPYKLTGAQMRVIEEIMGDLEQEQPMNRLVQGEVGSGKTVVAAVIAYIAFLNGLKTLYMAPTEILAFQHQVTLTKLLEPFGIKVGIYTGSRKFTKSVILGSKATPESKKDPGQARMTKSPDVIVGTHALLSEKLEVEDVGLIIVDEQQRFGVGQRTILRSKAKIPHFLTMTATPIPRTVALTLYGDLDLSIIDELPKGRKAVRTHVVPSKKRSDAYKFIDKKVKEGDQVYLITPLIEESESLTAVKAATVEFEKLKTKIFPHLKLGLLHGRMKPKEKEQALIDFKDKKIDILVSTSVVEVGVDIPNATIMVIEGAERFGLAQLHQLRGRVGRGEKESFCLLFPGLEDSATVSRLKNLEKTFDGLKLAELDLKIRGSGEIFGTKQSGRFELKIASFADLALIEKTRAAAKKISEMNPTLDKYPQLRLKLAQFGTGVMPD